MSKEVLHNDDAWIELIVLIVTLCVLWLWTYGYFEKKIPESTSIKTCIKTMKSIEGAVELFFLNHENNFNVSIEALEPNYLKKIPHRCITVTSNNHVIINKYHILVTEVIKNNKIPNYDIECSEHGNLKKLNKMY